MAWGAYETMSPITASEEEYESAARTLASLADKADAVDDLAEVLEMIGYTRKAK